MSVAVLSRAPWLRFLQLSRVGTAQLLSGIVAVSFLGRLFSAWVRPTPTFFPDEYLYAELGRSIAAGGAPLVRDVASGFPSLLYPLFTAPFWLIDDVETAFRAIQAFDAAVMSFAALPVFAIARQLDLSRTLALLAAMSALVVPDLLLSGWLVAEPLAYPLVLGSVWATLRVIDRPSVGNQILLLGLLGLTTLARFQLVVLPVAALTTVLAVGARERRLVNTMKEQWLLVSVAATLIAGGATLLAAGRLGVYSGALALNIDAVGIATWAAPTAFLVAYAAGWLVIPGALVGLAAGIARPRSRAEGGLSVLTVLLGLGLLAEAGFISDAITNDLHERYVFYLSPLLVLSFCVWLQRRAPGGRWYAAITFGLGLVAVLVPLSRYSAGDGKTDAAFLRALGGLENAVGDTGSASALVAGCSLIGCLVALGAYRAGPQGLRLVLVGALLVGVATSALAASFDRDNALRVEERFVGGSASWIDRLDVGPTAFLWSKDGRPAAAHETLFWNRSVDRVVLLPEAAPFDNFAVTAASIGSDGTVRNGENLLPPWILVDEYAATLAFAGGLQLGDVGGLSLYRFDGEPRLLSQFIGRYGDGFLAPSGQLTVWPATEAKLVDGHIRLTVRAPKDGPDRTLQFVASEPANATAPTVERTVVVRAGTAQTVFLDACSAAGPWQIGYTATPSNGDNERAVTVQASEVTYLPTRNAGGSSCSQSP